MGWREFTGWLEVMKRQREPPVSPIDSWAGTDTDPWWQEARAERARQVGR
jgi:hypothetical protein